MLLRLTRHAVGTMERHGLAGFELLTRLGRELTAPWTGSPWRQELDLLERRVDELEGLLTQRADELAQVRRELGSLITQLNERLLPGVDERMHETERDLARLGTQQLQIKNAALQRENRLQVAEQRVTDLRAKVARLEQRGGLWRELQAVVAKLGDDVDALRARLNGSLAEPEVMP